MGLQRKICSEQRSPSLLAELCVDICERVAGTDIDWWARVGMWVEWWVGGAVKCGVVSRGFWVSHVLWLCVCELVLGWGGVEWSGVEWSGVGGLCVCYVLGIACAMVVCL